MSSQTLTIALLSVTLSALAQTAFKWGMSQPAVTEAIAVLSTQKSPWALLTILAHPSVLSGFVLYGVGAVLWLFVLARLDLSVAYPFVGLAFIATMVIGALLFHESVTPTRIAGTLLVCLGVWLVARS